MLQERIEKMEKELAELKVLAKKEEFKKGDYLYFGKSWCGWFQENRVGRIEDFYENGFGVKIYSVEWGGTGAFDFRDFPKYEIRKATPSEIESHLIKEAEKKGFVKGAKVTYSKHAGSEEIDYLFIQCTTHRLAKCPPKDYSNCDVAIQLKNNGWAFLSECELLPSCPQITVGGHKVEFKIDHIVVGCTEVRVSTIKEILKHYETK